MALIVISGPVANVMQETEVYGAQSSGVTGATRVHSRKKINFRVGNKPVMMQLKATIDLAEGDDATVVGTEKGSGVVTALAVRNDKTGVVYSHNPYALMGWGVVLILGGFIFLAVYIGFLIIAAGVFMIYKGVQTKNALGKLKAATPAALAGAS